MIDPNKPEALRKALQTLSARLEELPGFSARHDCDAIAGVANRAGEFGVTPDDVAA